MLLRYFHNHPLHYIYFKKVGYNIGMKILKRDSILEYLRTVKEEFANRGIERVALFGSFANNKDGVYSDIDIAIKKSNDFIEKYTPYDYFELLNDMKANIRKFLKRDVDIFDLDSNSSFLNDIKDELIYV